MFVDEKPQGELQGGRPDLGTLRVDRLLALAEEIERPMRGWVFNMAHWPHCSHIQEYSCGTPACIGGTAEMLFKEVAFYALGVTPKQASELFFSQHAGGPKYDAIGRAWAARTLRHLAATGIVDWNATKESRT